MSSTEKHPCSSCHGSGKCSRCDGTGHLQHSATPPISIISGTVHSESRSDQRRPCSKCMGSGMCQTCHGAGRVAVTEGSE